MARMWIALAPALLQMTVSVRDHAQDVESNGPDDLVPGLEVSPLATFGDENEGQVGRQIVKATWTCANPDICTGTGKVPKVGEKVTGFFYKSSGKNSGGNMAGTWTPFQGLQEYSPEFVKLPKETCFPSWKRASPTLFQHAVEFGRFGYSFQYITENPIPYGVKEALVVSYKLGGGVWDRDLGQKIASETGLAGTTRVAMSGEFPIKSLKEIQMLMGDSGEYEYAGLDSTIFMEDGLWCNPNDGSVRNAAGRIRMFFMRNKVNTLGPQFCRIEDFPNECKVPDGRTSR